MLMMTLIKVSFLTAFLMANEFIHFLTGISILANSSMTNSKDLERTHLQMVRSTREIFSTMRFMGKENLFGRMMCELVISTSVSLRTTNVQAMVNTPLLKPYEAKFEERYTHVVV